ncbi:MAG: carboxypeptidase-like regulatory domain-containing protein [Acetatifactor sp.]|nr:carboxypeptidase-like regulatory domain-containing protein [Acetatifactor sp.]
MTFLSDFAEEAYAAGDVIEFTCGYAGDVWPDANEYRIKVTVGNDGIIYSKPFVVTEAIKSVEILNLDKPVAGETLDYDATIRTNPKYSDAIKTSEIKWVKTGTNLKLLNTAKAVNGQSYNCEIILTPKEGYGFEKKDDGSYVMDISCSWAQANTQVGADGRLHITFGPITATEAVTQYSISGAITPAGAASDDITIQLYDQNGINRLNEVVVAGSAASYAFNNVAPGTYTLNVSAPGCAIATTQITVSDGNVVKDITMYLNQKLSHTLSVQNNLAINYYVAQSAIPNLTNVALSIEKDVYDTGAKTIEKTVLPSKLGDYGHGIEHKFVYEGVASYQAVNEIRASLVGEYNGVKYTFAPDVYSIETYCYNQIGKSTVAAKTKRLLVDLLNYCSASQAHFGIKVDTLANRNLTSAQKALGTTTAPALSKIDETVALAGATARFNGKTLVLGNNVDLKIYILFDSSVKKENVRLRIKYQNVSGENVVAYIPYSEFSYDASGDEYSAKYSGLIAPEFRKVMQITVLEGDKEISDTVNYSIETYAYNRVNGSSKQTLKDVVTEMMKYSDSALAYFN